MRGHAALEWCAANGLHHVHFGSEDVAEFSEAAEFAAAAADLGVRLSAYAIRELERVGISDMDVATDVVDRALRTIHELDVPLVYLPSFGDSAIRDSSSLERTARLIAYALERTNAMVASENTLDAELNRILFSSIGDPRARLLFDTQNPCLVGLSPSALVLELADLLAPSIHVKDGVDSGEGNTAIARGAAGVRETLGALQKIGYRGDFTFETDYRRSADHLVGDDIATLNMLRHDAR
jgi:sugar phosphate isomerase/epimerase